MTNHFDQVVFKNIEYGAIKKRSTDFGSASNLHFESSLLSSISILD